VTDHDTMANVGPATAAARRYGMAVVPGIEVTSVHEGRDVHVLAYFLSEDAPGLQDMLSEQRRLRLQRARDIADRLAALGAPIDVAALVEGARKPGGKSLGRPQIARALVAAGHVSSVAEAFERYLGETGPAYVPHRGASPAEVVELVSASGGLTSLAHPCQLNNDTLIPVLAASGLDAIEAYHSSHDVATQERYVTMAAHHRIGVTGGSDYHGEGTRRSEFFGVTNLPAEHFDALLERAAHVRTTLA
jgi:predicted metal-dependent phosphoesterase TrpH